MVYRITIWSYWYVIWSCAITTYIQFEIRLGFFKATHFDCFEATTCSLPKIKMNLIFNQENISKHVRTMGLTLISHKDDVCAQSIYRLKQQFFCCNFQFAYVNMTTSCWEIVIKVVYDNQLAGILQFPLV